MTWAQTARTIITCVLFGALAGIAQNSCTQPQPGPAPIPVPVADASPVDAPVSDIFTGKVFDCHGFDLDVRNDTLPIVAGCLKTAAVVACLTTVQRAPALVACLVRDVGANANAAVLAGSTDPADEIVADQARGFISSHQVGYR